MKDKKDLTILKDSFSLVLLFSSAVTRAFSSYKRESRVSHEGEPDLTSNRSDPDTHKSSNRALSTLSLLSLETWDMSLSRLFVTPTINFQC